MSTTNPDKTVAGNYYNWGITVDQSLLNNNASYCTDTDTAGLGKSNISGWVKVVPADSIGDAATKNWGENWRMPTGQGYYATTGTGEFWDLRRNTENHWCSGANGSQFEGTSIPGYSSKGKDGYANDSIFFPAAGICYGCSFYSVGSDGIYWSSVPESINAYALGFNSVGAGVSEFNRNFGRSVRAVAK